MRLCNRKHYKVFDKIKQWNCDINRWKEVIKLEINGWIWIRIEEHKENNKEIEEHTWNYTEHVKKLNLAGQLFLGSCYL